jgi:hypothetical protein
MQMVKRLLLLCVACAVVAVAACSWDYPIWIPRTKTADPLYRFERGGKAGYIDRTGKIVIAPAWKVAGNSGSEFHEGLLEVGIRQGRYVDASQKPAFPEDLYVGSAFSEGLAVAKRRGEDAWGYIDRSGAFKIQPRFAAAPRFFQDGLARIQDGENFGYIDRSGAVVIRPQFLAAGDFNDGMARVVLQGPCVYAADGPCGPENLVRAGEKMPNPPACKFTFIDRTGRPIANEKLDDARNFAEGLAPVQKNGRWGFIDKRGALAIAARFEDAQPFSDGLALVQVNGSYGYIDHQGKLVIPPWFQYADDFSDGLAAVGNEEEGYWYIDKTGQETIGGRFAAASPFFKGLAHVQLLDEEEGPTNTFAYIDRSGRQVFRYQR